MKGFEQIMKNMRKVPLQFMSLFALPGAAFAASDIPAGFEDFAPIHDPSMLQNMIQANKDTILGMELFSHKLRFDFDGQAIEPFGETDDNVSTVNDIPMSNFNNFLSSTASVFIVLAGDGWTSIFFDHYRVVGSLTSTFFFVSLIILG